MVLTKKFSQFTSVTPATISDANEKVVGLENGVNMQSTRFLSWTTAGRPPTPFNGLLGVNTDLEQYEWWDAPAGQWFQLEDSGDIQELIDRLAAHTVGDGASMIGLLNQSNVTNKTVQDLANATFIAQTNNGTLQNAQFLGSLTTGIVKNTTVTGVLSISAPLTSIDGLSLSANQFIYSTSSSAYTTLGPLTNGQLIIGSTGLAPVAASLTAGSGVTITPGAGSITISATGSGGTVTSISAGTGIVATPNPITTTGSIALDPAMFPYIVSPVGFYTTIQAAIDAAALVATSTNLQVVLINSGTYTENLTLKSFVNLASYGGTSKDAVIIQGNAIYNAANDNEDFSASGITFLTPGGGGTAFSIQGAKIVSVNMNDCAFNGTTGTAFECANANALVFKSSCHLEAFAGQKVLNMTAGKITTLNGKVIAVDTASTLSGGELILTGCFDNNSFILTNSAQISVVNSVVITPDVLPLVNVGATAIAIIFGNTIISNATSGFWAEGTGSIAANAVTTLAGGATDIDPALTKINEPLTIGSLNVLGQGQTLDMNTHFITNVIDPINPQDAATKNYVDQTALTGTSVYAASAGSLGTVTQSGAGVGATLTNAGVQATFALDSVNPPVGQPVLIKNTATGMTAANEGIYIVSDAGSAGTNWVLTRSPNYDTPEQINDTGLIIVQNGSTLAGTAWYNTNTIVTVDTTAFNFAQFGNSGTVTSVGSGTGLTGGPITTTGTLSFAAIAAHSLWANVTGGSAVPTVVATAAFLQTVGVQVITSNVTYTPTTGTQFMMVEICGGGGSGGAVSGGTAGQSSAGAGGGGGGYCRKLYTAVQLGANAAVVIGTGGAGAAAGANNGNAGGTSTFTPAGAGVILTATGGGLGTGMAQSAAAQIAGGGTSGSGTNGDINIDGARGGQGATQATGLLAISGTGGGTYFAPSSHLTPITIAASGSSAIPVGYGCGSNGAFNIATANTASNAGANGVCVITEFIAI